MDIYLIPQVFFAIGVSLRAPFQSYVMVEKPIVFQMTEHQLTVLHQLTIEPCRDISEAE